jgi:hypothetical protein
MRSGSSPKEKKACGAASEEALEPKVQVGDLVLAILSSFNPKAKAMQASYSETLCLCLRQETICSGGYRRLFLWYTRNPK